MNKSEIIQLQTKLEEHYELLIEKYPITQLVLEAIETLLEMNAPDSLIEPWYKSLRGFIRDIEKEIRLLERKEDYDTARD